MNKQDILDGLKHLQPETPWAHHFDLGHGIETVTPLEEKFYRKAVGLKLFGELVEKLATHHTRRGNLDGMRVLDIASGEGAHSIALAKKGARVVGIEGRTLYMDRANYVARVVGYQNVRFIQGDVRSMNPDELGTFDLVLCSGILHHLNKECFGPFLRTVAELTEDTMILYTHISTDLSIKNHRLQGPVEGAGGYEGYLFREHADDTTVEERLNKVRASLDNTQSFWATEPSLMKGLSDAGFEGIYKLVKPHIFSKYEDASYRPIIICRRS